MDVTLVDREGNELEMPTLFDNSAPRAARNYLGMTAAARANMELLTGVSVEKRLFHHQQRMVAF